MVSTWCPASGLIHFCEVGGDIRLKTLKEVAQKSDQDWWPLVGAPLGLAVYNMLFRCLDCVSHILLFAARGDEGKILM